MRARMHPGLCRGMAWLPMFPRCGACLARGRTREELGPRLVAGRHNVRDAEPLDLGVNLLQLCGKCGHARTHARLRQAAGQGRAPTPQTPLNIPSLLRPPPPAHADMASHTHTRTHAQIAGYPPPPHTHAHTLGGAILAVAAYFPPFCRPPACHSFAPPEGAGQAAAAGHSYWLPPAEWVDVKPGHWLGPSPCPDAHAL